MHESRLLMLLPPQRTTRLQAANLMPTHVVSPGELVVDVKQVVPESVEAQYDVAGEIMHNALRGHFCLTDSLHGQSIQSVPRSAHLRM